MKRRNSSIMATRDNHASQHSHLTQHHPSRATARARIEQHARFRIPSQTTTTTTTTTTSSGSSDDDDDPPPSFSPLDSSSSSYPPPPAAAAAAFVGEEKEHSDFFNYALLIVLYTLQGIPMGLSASIPFLIQQKIKLLASTTTATTATAAAADSVLAAASSSTTAAAAAAASASRLAYKANAIFALCSWPFSLKLLWAPIVDACFLKSFGRRKSWLVPAQTAAGLLMVTGATFVERQLGLDSSSANANANALHHSTAINVQAVTAFFFALYFLMATQDIAVDGWALTMLSKKNRGRGPVCNSIGQNIGYFLSFVGFLALNDAESSESLWRPLLGLPSNPQEGLVSLQSFIRCMGYLMLVTTTAVALFKRETTTTTTTTSIMSSSSSTRSNRNGNRLSPATEALLQQSDRRRRRLAATDKMDQKDNKKFDDQYSNDTDDNTDDDDDKELDASEIGLKETYHRLWAVCKLPAVRWLFLILLTYRLPTALSDNVKFLKAVEYGLSKSTTALLSPTVILPLGILVPIVATKIWHGHPLRQFMSAYKVRVTLAPLVDMLLLWMLQQRGKPSTRSGVLLFWGVLVLSTALQAIVNSLQFNAQMTFFAHRVDPAIGGSYMTLLNTAANLGGTWPASMVMWMVGRLTKAPVCQSVDGTIVDNNGSSSALPDVVCTGGRDPYYILQLVLSGLGCLWIVTLGGKVKQLAALPDEAWRTHLLDDATTTLSGLDVEQGVWTNSTTTTTPIPYPRLSVGSGSNSMAWWQNSSTGVKDSKGE